MIHMNMQKIISLAITLIIIAVILPIGLVYLSTSGDVQVLINGTYVTLSEVADPTVITLLTVLVPILVVVAIVMYFVPKNKA